MLNLPSLEEARVHAKPFPFVVVPNFVTDESLEEIDRDYPAITKPGSFPLEALRSGPSFAKLVHELHQPTFRKIVERKLAINLEKRPVTITVRGQARRTDGRIHLDSRSKLVTVLLYMNGRWEADGGRLRLLNSPDNLRRCCDGGAPSTRYTPCVSQRPECVASVTSRFRASAAWFN